jgi:hypothetical protein
MWLVLLVLFVGASGGPAIQATPKPLQIAASLYGVFQNAPKQGCFGRCGGDGDKSVPLMLAAQPEGTKEGPDGSQALKGGSPSAMAALRPPLTACAPSG